MWKSTTIPSSNKMVTMFFNVSEILSIAPLSSIRGNWIVQVHKNILKTAMCVCGGEWLRQGLVFNRTTDNTR